MHNEVGKALVPNKLWFQLQNEWMIHSKISVIEWVTVNYFIILGLFFASKRNSFCNDHGPWCESIVLSEELAILCPDFHPLLSDFEHQTNGKFVFYFVFKSIWSNVFFEFQSDGELKKTGWFVTSKNPERNDNSPEMQYSQFRENQLDKL